MLDVGSGSGYLTCCFAALVAPGGEVVGVEHGEGLRGLGEGNARKAVGSREWVESGEVRFVVGDGRRGWRDGRGGWDVIVSFWFLSDWVFARRRRRVICGWVDLG